MIGCRPCLIRLAPITRRFGRILVARRRRGFPPTGYDPCGKKGVWGYTVLICNALVHLRPRNVNEVVAVMCALNLPLEPQGRISVAVLMSMSLQRGLN